MVDVVIPTFNERGYIERTFKNLTDQTLYKKDKVHIIVADYKNILNDDDDYLRELCDSFEHISYLTVPRKGIGFARNMAVEALSRSNIILNFDADCLFNREDAIELMIAPIIAGEARITNCEAVKYDMATNMIVADHHLNDLTGLLEALTKKAEKLAIGRGQGLTVDKNTFYSVNGFRDIPQWEDYFLTWDICTRYSIYCKKYIRDVICFKSNRHDKNKVPSFTPKQHSK